LGDEIFLQTSKKSINLLEGVNLSQNFEKHVLRKILDNSENGDIRYPKSFIFTLSGAEGH
jgi:hypothetical protein